MNSPKTEEELVAFHWWWRRTRFLFPRNAYDPNIHDRRAWNDGLEQTAFEYELVRRVCKTRHLPPFVELDGGMQHDLYHQLCPPHRKSARKKTTEANPRGWSEPNAEGWRFNLDITNNRLLESLRIRKLPTEAEIINFVTSRINEKQLNEILVAKKTSLPSKAKFLAFINEQRAAQGVIPPRGLQGQRNVPISWRWIELLDIAQFKIKRIHTEASKDVERQTRRRARVMAQKLLPKYLQAIDELENAFWRPKKKTPSIIPLANLKTN
jgi:hypothetical protein